MKKTYVTPDVEILDFANTACHIKTILNSNGDVIRTECDYHGANCSTLGLGSGNASNNANHNSNSKNSGGWVHWFFGWWF